MHEHTQNGNRETPPRVNIWSMNKDQSIKHLLLLLTEQLGIDAFHIDERLATDAKAVYIRHRRESDLKAYLYTVGQTNDRYGVHLEYPYSSDAEWIYEATENIPLTTLVDILAAHLDVDEITPLPML